MTRPLRAGFSLRPCSDGGEDIHPDVLLVSIQGYLGPSGTGIMLQSSRRIAAHMLPTAEAQQRLQIAAGSAQEDVLPTSVAPCAAPRRHSSRALLGGRRSPRRSMSTPPPRT